MVPCRCVQEPHFAQAVCGRAAAEGTAWGRDRRGGTVRVSVHLRRLAPGKGWPWAGYPAGGSLSAPAWAASLSLLCRPARCRWLRFCSRCSVQHSNGRLSECLVVSCVQNVKQITKNTVLNTPRLHNFPSCHRNTLYLSGVAWTSSRLSISSSSGVTRV